MELFENEIINRIQNDFEYDSLFEETAQEEKTMTTRELAETLGVSVRTVQQTIERLGLTKVFSQVKIRGQNAYVFNEQQATLIKQEIQKHHNLATRQIDKVTTEAEGKILTTKELAKQLKCNSSTITENAKKCLPNKKIENGKPTYWNEREITILIAFMKQKNNRTDLSDQFDRLKNTKTSLLDDFEFFKLQKQKDLIQKQLDEYRDKRLAELELENQNQKIQLKIQAPKVEFYDNLCDSTNYTDIQTVGKKTGIGANNIFKVLVGDKIIYQKYTNDGLKYYVAYSDYEKYFVLIPRTLEINGIKKSNFKLMFNAKGVVWATNKYKAGA